MRIRDGDFELCDYDPHTGRSVWSFYNGEKTVYRIDYPVDGIIKANTAEKNATGPGWKGDWHKVASVPLNILHGSGLNDAMTQQDDRFVKRWLNDSDNGAWRTKEGRV